MYQEEVTLKKWLVTLILLTIPIFNFFYFVYLLFKKNEIGRWARASLIYFLVLGILSGAVAFYLISRNPKLTKNAISMVKDELNEDDNEEEIIVYEGQSPNSLDISDTPKTEQLYGNTDTGYIRLTGNYNIYSIPQNKGLASGIKIAGEEETYAIYRYTSQDMNAIIDGLKKAYAEKDITVNLEDAEISGIPAKKITSDNMTGYIFLINNEVTYIVGEGTGDIDYNLQTYSLVAE